MKHLLRLLLALRLSGCEWQERLALQRECVGSIFVHFKLSSNANSTNGSHISVFALLSLHIASGHIVNILRASLARAYVGVLNCVIHSQTCKNRFINQ